MSNHDFLTSLKNNVFTVSQQVFISTRTIPHTAAVHSTRISNSFLVPILREYDRPNQSRYEDDEKHNREPVE
jgi:hypothetical protein